jgi:methionine-rich copper-binding protein CopC
MKSRLVAAATIGLLLALFGGAEAMAAPTYLSSEPADGAKLHKPPKQVSITFSEPLDASSTMTVRDHCGRTLDTGKVQVELNEMRVGIAVTPSGHYMVTYTAVGIAGLTGSTKGNFSFEVHAGKSCSGADHGNHAGNNAGNGPGNGHGNGRNQEAHTPTDHVDHTDDQAATSHAHSQDGNGDHKKHGGDSGDKKGHERHQAAPNGDSGDRFQPQALDRGETPVPDLVPGSEAVLAALAAAATLGAVGGWLLRIAPLG